MQLQDVGGITTTEVCNISCVMCHFNGPKAPRKQGVLTVEEVAKFLADTPRGDTWFAGTGEFFMDPNALTHLRTAVALGHRPCVLTNGLLLTPELIDEILEIGVRMVAISCDEISQEKYGKIRIGGDLGVILRNCAELRARKARYPDLRVMINVTLFRKTALRQAEFEAFWRGKVDQVNFNAEYYDIFKFRNKFFEPQERNDCAIRVYMVPTGHMVPCCAMTVYQHHHDLPWLPHIKDTTPAEALAKFQAMYADPDSPLGKLCQQCDWWIMWAKDPENTKTAYLRCVPLDTPGAEPTVEVEPVVRVSLPLVAADGPPAAAPAAPEPTPAPAVVARPGVAARGLRWLGSLLRRGVRQAG